LQRKREAVIQSIAATIYEVPNLMLGRRSDVVALKKLDLPKSSSRFENLEYFFTQNKKSKTYLLGLIGNM
jgi:CTP synthase